MKAQKKFWRWKNQADGEEVHTVEAVVLMPFHTPVIHVVKAVHAVLAPVEMLVHMPEKKVTIAFHTVSAVVLMPFQMPLMGWTTGIWRCFIRNRWRRNFTACNRKVAEGNKASSV